MVANEVRPHPEPGAIPPGRIDVPDDLSSLQPPRDDEGPDSTKKPQQ